MYTADRRFVVVVEGLDVFPKGGNVLNYVKREEKCAGGVVRGEYVHGGMFGSRWQSGWRRVKQGGDSVYRLKLSINHTDVPPGHPRRRGHTHARCAGRRRPFQKCCSTEYRWQQTEYTVGHFTWITSFHLD